MMTLKLSEVEVAKAIEFWLNKTKFSSVAQCEVTNPKCEGASNPYTGGPTGFFVIVEINDAKEEED